MRQTASRVEFRRPMGENYVPVLIEATFETGGVSHKVTSMELAFDPQQEGVIPMPLSVAFPPGQPHQARIDFSGLPDVRFGSWRPIALAEFIAHIQQNGQEIIAQFAGFKLQSSSDEDDPETYVNVLAVLQYRDWTSNRLIVFEAFSLSDRKSPLPLWPLGTRFRGWYDPKDPADFHFEETPLASGDGIPGTT
jgi:hypothetical protein